MRSKAITTTCPVKIVVELRAGAAKMAKQEEQLDETQWRAPILVEQFRGINGDNGMNQYRFEKTQSNRLNLKVHRYFMESPFFDRTSNNWALAVQEARNNSMLIYDRRAFEAAVQTRFSSGGLEFMTTDEPQSDQGAWIVTKQERAKRPGAQDRVTVLGTYIIVGDVIIQAPSVIDVVGNRLVCPLARQSCFRNRITADDSPPLPALHNRLYP